MAHVYHSKISQLSGGEYKRFSIASELILGRGLIALDEPTTGLSARESLYLGDILRSLADQQIAVVASIHQPRSDVLKFFDYIIVLSKGKQVFFGTKDDAVSFFSSFQKNLELKEIPNQAEFICKAPFFLKFFYYLF